MKIKKDSILGPTFLRTCTAGPPALRPRYVERVELFMYVYTGQNNITCVSIAAHVGSRKNTYLLLTRGDPCLYLVSSLFLLVFFSINLLGANPGNVTAPNRSSAVYRQNSIASIDFTFKGGIATGRVSNGEFRLAASVLVSSRYQRLTIVTSKFSTITLMLSSILACDISGSLVVTFASYYERCST